MTNKLDRLRAKPTRVELTIPGEKKPISWIEIKGAYSHEYMSMAQQIVERAEKLTTVEEITESRADLLLTIVTNWDEETFGAFSKGAVREVLMDEEFFWIPDQLEVAVAQTTRFLTPGAGKSKRSSKPVS